MENCLLGRSNCRYAYTCCVFHP